jgi:DNA-binding LacI/PurR family transcriptional regulator
MNTVGLVFLHGNTPTHTNPFLTTVLDGVLSVNMRRRQNTTLCTISSWEQAEDHLTDLYDGRCDGVLMMVPPVDCVLVDVLLQRKVPFVLINGHDASGQASGVDVDNVVAACRMTQYLLGLGHRRIAYVFEECDGVYPFARERQAGYRQAMTAHGGYDPALADYTLERALSPDLPPDRRPTAFLCSHDAQALMLIEQFEQRGVLVPSDVSIVGFDDIPGAAAARPALTTVRQPMTQIGERGAEMLPALIDKTGSAGRQEILPTELVIRQSAAPPRAGG